MEDTVMLVDDAKYPYFRALPDGRCKVSATDWVAIIFLRLQPRFFFAT